MQYITTSFISNIEHNYIATDFFLSSIGMVGKVVDIRIILQISIPNIE